MPIFITDVRTIPIFRVTTSSGNFPEWKISVLLRCQVRKYYFTFLSDECQNSRTRYGSALKTSKIRILLLGNCAKVFFGLDSALFDLFPGLSFVYWLTPPDSYKTSLLVPLACDQWSPPAWPSPLLLIFLLFAGVNFGDHANRIFTLLQLSS